MTQRDKWARRPVVLQYRAFKDRCRDLGVRLPARFRVVFWIPMPTSWSARKRHAMEGGPHQVRPDLDNLLKALADAACVEDSHLWSVHAEKRWSTEPGIEISELLEEAQP